MFRALCVHHQEVRIYYTATGIVTPVGGRPVLSLSPIANGCFILENINLV